MTRIMYDGVNVSRLPRNAGMVAGYVDGKFANVATMHMRFPDALIVQIAVSHSTNAGQVLDVETGDATPSGAVQWAVMRRKAGQDPTVYCNKSTLPAVKSAFAHADVTLPHFWIADWNGVDDVPPGCVAHQYQTTTGYDISSVAAFWPGVDHSANKPTPPAHPQGMYIVRHGDTLSQIAVDFHTTVDSLVKLNNLTNPNFITVGQKLKLSGNVGVEAHTAYYTVQKGDTLSAIASAHHESLHALIAKNHQIKNPDVIYPGDKIYL